MLSINLASVLEHHARARPRHPAIVDGGTTIDYRELDALVRGYAAWLTQHDLRSGDIIGVALGDTPAHIVALYALARLGIVILPMDYRWTVAEQSNLAQFFGAKLVLARTGAPILDGAPSLAGDRLPAPRWEPGPAAVGDGETPLLLSLSSGTTGRPRGPLLRHRHFLARFVGHWVTLTFNGLDRFLLATPLYFGGGRAFAMSCLFVGATVVFRPPPFAPEELVATVNAQRISVLFLVPTQLRWLLSLPAPAGRLMPDLRVLVSSGSVLHAHERAAIMARLTESCFEYYASTEGGGISVLTPAEQRAKPDSVGRAAFMVDVEIVDDDHQPLAVGQIGHVRYRGPAVVPGFFNDPEGSDQSFRDGWFYPGDLARMDEDGYLYIAGRAKDMIIRAGVNIYPAEIEHVLLSHREVAEAAVVGAPSAESGEDVVAFVVKRGVVTEAALKAHCRASLAPYKRPSRIVFLDDMPRNNSGKIDKRQLAARLTPA